MKTEEFYNQLPPREKRMVSLALKGYSKIPLEQRRREMGEFLEAMELERRQHPIRVWLRERWRVLRNLMWPGLFSSDGERELLWLSVQLAFIGDASFLWNFIKYVFTGNDKYFEDWDHESD